MPIVAGVDRSSRAESVVSHGYDLADKCDVELHVVHVGARQVGDGGLERGREEASEVAADVAEKTIGQTDFEPIGLVGDPAEKLLEYGENQDAEYIVINARKRTRLDHAIFGGVSQSLLLAADRPVVTVP
ncbi:universal stress protein [Natrialba swarupiae]|uniref:Universal stress protein n=1 Tax=Natrialba swarupiae TaxID=2448032 RepID=A0A5D5AJV4_9EURY|nr:universal stress protein [Natrialba swarupiae]TYT61966.1 universal stress protein [Natrialba swarupiae]